MSKKNKSSKTIARPSFSPMLPSECAAAEMSARFDPRNPVYISKNMSGKMEGILALSTSRTLNHICAARAAIPGSVCAECYAGAVLARYSALRDHMEDNYKVLNARDLLPEELPLICSDVCRLEAFGDLASATQARNYLRIARRNPWCLFVLWTKNPEYMQTALDDLGRPENIIFIYSSPELNKPALDIRNKYAWFDHVFTVWTAAGAAAAGIEINCGGRKCRACMHCYTRGTAFEINELLK